MAEISDRSIVHAIKEHVSCDLAAESVILDLKRGLYYGLNPVGSWIWGQIQEPKVVRDVMDAMLKEYEVDADLCRRDLIALLKALQENELIDVKNDR
jgi:Coenzyme PQQ synthesis protein D (PqqD)